MLRAYLIWRLLRIFAPLLIGAVLAIVLLAPRSTNASRGLSGTRAVHVARDGERSLQP